ncbi:uncharacterized protein LOC111289411 isoform X3 [Durio zibethinus]|uniref:Uncharacterized protein LOC111289411 isoform X3 n=1 Tax=Durio zibethinus TaxID=66656 RepID=A0A6P5Y883_DURZI|nr:uncharacterized protein LOC111289411 isoform X3 [Durio zibethinus]
MVLLQFQSNLHFLPTFYSFNPSRSNPIRQSPSSFRRRTWSPLTEAALKRNVEKKNDKKKTNICTADELHYVQVEKSEWRVALWRYLPSPKAPSRNHPLMLLSGVGTNAIGYDLSPESSFARFMSGQGYDTWILELRGAGLSAQGVDIGQVKDPLDAMSQRKDFYVKDGKCGTHAYTNYKSFSIKGSFSGFSETEKGFDFAGQVKDFIQKLVNIIEEAERSSPARLFDMQSHISTALKDVQKQLDLVAKYDWDFDHYLEEDVPAAADPAQVLNVPVIPIGTLLAAAHPFATRPPYILSWLNSQISAPDMMPPKLFDKLVMENFETVPAKLLLQLTTAFQEGGLRDRSGMFFYKDHLSKSNVPVLAIAGDQDLICPPEAVYETVKLIPKPLVAYKVFGEPGGPHYAHYDIVGGRLKGADRKNLRGSLDQVHTLRRYRKHLYCCIQGIGMGCIPSQQRQLLTQGKRGLREETCSCIFKQSTTHMYIQK